jgi:hypothetical protein
MLSQKRKRGGKKLDKKAMKEGIKYQASVT